MLFYQVILEVTGVTEVLVAYVTIVIFPFSCMWDEWVVIKGHVSMKWYYIHFPKKVVLDPFLLRLDLR